MLVGGSQPKRPRRSRGQEARAITASIAAALLGQNERNPGAAAMAMRRYFDRHPPAVQGGTNYGRRR